MTSKSSKETFTINSSASFSRTKTPKVTERGQKKSFVASLPRLIKKSWLEFKHGHLKKFNESLINAIEVINLAFDYSTLIENI